MPKKMQGPERMTTNVLGVHFIWPRPGPNWREPTKSGMIATSDALLRVVRPFMIRQKRDVICFWDAMTVLNRGEVFPRHHPESKTWGLATELTVAIREGKIADRSLVELGSMPLVNSVRTRIAFRYASDRSTAARQEIDGPVDVEGRLRAPQSGAYRRFELEMPDLRGDAAAIDWFDVTLTAVLVHLKADLELYLETDFLPVRVCGRRACRSFFRVHRMAGRHQYCSDTCRACAAREQ